MCGGGGRDGAWRGGAEKKMVFVGKTNDIKQLPLVCFNWSQYCSY